MSVALRACIVVSTHSCHMGLNQKYSHIDPYENVYTVIRGKKHFTLFPPTEGWCLKGKTMAR